jgi:serine/threonine protein kinase
MAAQQPAKPTNTVLPDEEFNKKWDQENLYQNVKRITDPRFGEISIVKNNTTNEVLFVKEKMASSKNEASNDIRELKSRIDLNHAHLQKLISYSTAVKKELCSTHYLSRGFYEFPRSDLLKEEAERKKNLTGFSSSELTHLAYQILDGLNHLHTRNISHGDIRPLNIGYHKVANEFQILDRLSDPSPLEKLQASNIINKKNLYISPEVYNKLQGKDKTMKYNPYKNDLYGLGLTILELGSSESVQDIYKPNGEFNQSQLDKHLATFNGKYQNENPYLCTIVKTLVAIREDDRPDSQQFVNNIIPYDQFKHQEAQGIKIENQISDNYHNANYTNNLNQQNNLVHAEPYNDRVIVNRAENEDSKNQGNYSNINSTQDNTNATYIYGQQPVYTYQVNNQYSNEQPSYVSNVHAPIYSYATPVNTQTYTQPTYTTYAETVPYNNSNDQVFYPHSTVTVVQSSPQTYVYSQPNATFVNAPADGTKIERKSYNTYQVPIERKSYTAVEPNAEGRLERKSYTHYAVNPQINQNEQKGPVTYVYNQPYEPVVQRKSYTTVSYVQSTPTYTTYAQPTSTYINHQSYATPVNSDLNGTNTTVIPGQPYTIDANGNKIPYLGPLENQTSTVQYTQVQEVNRVVTHATPVSYVVPENQNHYAYSNNVEIRHGNYVQPTQEEQNKKVHKKYIIEGDKVIEVEVNENGNQEQHQ